MKKIFFVSVLAGVLLSCGPSKVEKLILAYEQTIGNTKTDLSMKIQKLKDVGKITGNDSLKVLLSTFEIKKAEKIEYLTKSIKQDSILLLKSKKDASDPDVGFIYQSSVELYSDLIKSSKKAIEIYKTDCKGTFLEISFQEIKKYESIKDSVLEIKYDCTYTIKNPFLNNVTQTIKKTYYISSDLNKVISTSTI